MTWRDAASLVLAARNAQHLTKHLPSACNYKLLCLRRNQTMKFMPGSYVFPGGTTDSADADLKWKHLFSNFGFSSDSFAALLPNAARRPGIFDTEPNALPKEVSLRITAIRETFEECGVLLCKQSKDTGENAKWASHLVVPEEKLREWRTKVHEDAKHFYIMCEELKCYPDLWSLHEWSNWMTPTTFKRRFDTAFFMACMSSIPHALHDISEVDELRWDVPKNLLRDIPLPIPQLHEILQIAKFDSVEDVLKIAVERSKLGSQRILPVTVKANDGVVTVLPSDSLYPEEVSLIEPQIIDKSAMSIVELRASLRQKSERNLVFLPKESDW